MEIDGLGFGEIGEGVGGEETVFEPGVWLSVFEGPSGERCDEGGGDGFDAGGEVVVGGDGVQAMTGVFVGDGGVCVVETAVCGWVDEREAGFIGVSLARIYGKSGWWASVR